jgi:hypothetical protein
MAATTVTSNAARKAQVIIAGRTIRRSAFLSDLSGIPSTGPSLGAERRGADSSGEGLKSTFRVGPSRGIVYCVHKHRGKSRNIRTRRTVKLLRHNMQKVLNRALKNLAGVAVKEQPRRGTSRR